MITKDLLKSKHFCVLPFIHSCIWTDGRILPCCINQDYVLGNAKTNSLTDVYSNKNIKLVELRKEMLNGPELPPSCYRCSTPEENYADNSYRHYVNRDFGYLIDSLDIHIDGTVTENKVSTWDVRFSNLCNLKCRTCDNINSSKIAEEEKKHIDQKITVLKEAFDDKEEFFNFFRSNIDNIQEIYFCGGEPLLLEEHYAMLDLLVEYKKFHVILRYNTNCTKLKFKDKDVVNNYWSKFEKVHLGLSLDAGWEQLYYIRHGANWDTVLENLKHIKNRCPDVKMQLTPTISILNAFHVKKLQLFLIDENLLDINAVYYNILTYPNYYSLTALPADLKEQVKDHWMDFKLEAKAKGSNHHLESEIDKVIKYMYTEDQTHVLEKFQEETKFRDEIRSESFSTIFPELITLYEK